jgi:ChrB-like protein
MAKWLLLHYKIPTEPSASRVYIWRKLKRLGALLHQDAVWVLPDTPRNYEQFQWLAAEIAEMGGEATFWAAQPALAGQDEGMVQQFASQTDQAYQELLDALGQPAADLDVISRQYQLVKSRDYFNSVTGQQVRDRLLTVRGAPE